MKQSNIILCVQVSLSIFSTIMIYQSSWYTIPATFGIISIFANNITRYSQLEKDLYYLELIVNEIVKKLNSEQLMDVIAKLKPKSQFGRPIKK